MKEFRDVLYIVLGLMNEQGRTAWGAPFKPTYRACPEPSQGMCFCLSTKVSEGREDRVNKKDFRQQVLSIKPESSVGSHKIVSGAVSVNASKKSLSRKNHTLTTNTVWPEKKSKRY